MKLDLGEPVDFVNIRASLYGSLWDSLIASLVVSLRASIWDRLEDDL